MTESDTKSGANGTLSARDVTSIVRQRVGGDAATRILSATWRGQSCAVVVDVSGLDAKLRSKLEAQLRQEIGVIDGASDLRIAMTAERPPGQINQTTATPQVSPVTRTGPRIIAIASGKGGVGKSTLSANVAVALHRLGRRVGMVDADIYGPSQPVLLGREHSKPQSKDGKLIPVDTAWGVPMLSMGQIAAPGQAVAWRGPMAGRALDQMVDAHWRGTDVLIVDMPPGTGDVQLTMVQKHKPDGAIIISTPQDLALIDATRAISLFDQAKVPIIGLVENMAGYQCPHCGKSSDPFGKGGAEAAAAALNIPFLGGIPLSLPLRQASDAGAPPAASDDPALTAPFMDIARRIADWIDHNPTTKDHDHADHQG